MSDATVLANALRQAELEARGRDLTKAIPPPGTDGESLRALKGFEEISDAILEERATFNLKEHMAKTAAVQTSTLNPTLNLSAMSPEELNGVANAALTELAQREGKQ